MCRAAAMSMLVSLSRRVTATRPLLPGSSRNWPTHPLEVNAPTARPGRLRFRAAFCRVSRHAPPREVSLTCAVRLTGRGIWPAGTRSNPKSLRVSASHPARRYSRDPTARGSATHGEFGRGDGDFERKLSWCDADASARFAWAFQRACWRRCHTNRNQLSVHMPSADSPPPRGVCSRGEDMPCLLAPRHLNRPTTNREHRR